MLLRVTIIIIVIIIIIIISIITYNKHTEKLCGKGELYNLLELYRSSDCHLLAKRVPTFADRSVPRGQLGESLLP
jgi:hypothetical protein